MQLTFGIFGVSTLLLALVCGRTFLLLRLNELACRPWFLRGRCSIATLLNGCPFVLPRQIEKNACLWKVTDVKGVVHLDYLNPSSFPAIGYNVRTVI